jgi:hypothetical protein
MGARREKRERERERERGRERRFVEVVREDV